MRSSFYSSSFAVPGKRTEKEVKENKGATDEGENEGRKDTEQSGAINDKKMEAKRKSKDDQIAGSVKNKQVAPPSRCFHSFPLLATWISPFICLADVSPCMFLDLTI
jgi:hypothetical protein